MLFLCLEYSSLKHLNGSALISLRWRLKLNYEPSLTTLFKSESPTQSPSSHSTLVAALCLIKLSPSDIHIIHSFTHSLGPASACPARPGPAPGLPPFSRGAPRGGHGPGAPGSAAVRPPFCRRAGGVGASPALVRGAGTCGPGQLSLPARSGPGLRAPGPWETLLSGGWQHHCDAPSGNMPN